jgi:4-hydroxy 2-oxovalerate aldolase
MGTFYEHDSDKWMSIMKKSITLLDVTLRDGGMKLDFQFKPHLLKQLLTHLDNSGIDYIEIGYRNGPLNPKSTIGAAGICQASYLRFCKDIIQNAKIAVMAHPKNIIHDDLVELKKYGVNLLRICITKGEYDNALTLIQIAKQQGLEVSANLTQISHYTECELDDILSSLSILETNMVYFADSNGSLLPEKVMSIYDKFSKRYDMKLGFHAHDNLGLAQANALSAINHGAEYIDVSLKGLGKGIGNLHTELFIAYLNAVGIKKYHLKPIIDASNYLHHALSHKVTELSLHDFMRGILDLSLSDAEKILKSHWD